MTRIAHHLCPFYHVPSMLQSTYTTPVPYYTQTANYLAICHRATLPCCRLNWDSCCAVYYRPRLHYTYATEAPRQSSTLSVCNGYCNWNRWRSYECVSLSNNVGIQLVSQCRNPYLRLKRCANFKYIEKSECNIYSVGRIILNTSAERATENRMRKSFIWAKCENLKATTRRSREHRMRMKLMWMSVINESHTCNGGFDVLSFVN